jgi:WD40 repeat protein
MRGPRATLVLIFLAANLAGAAHAQQGCEAPALAMASTPPNILTPAMESALGDIVAARVQGHIHFTDDPAATAYLAKVGARLERELPPNHIQFRLYLVDLPYPQAFEIPGGRIYVSQKLIAFVENEDELAGVLAHEMGHLVTRQSAVAMTASLKSVLGVTEIKSRDDVAKDFALLLENWRRNPEILRRGRSSDEELQAAADQVGLYTMALAGYSPQSFVDVFNRLAETKSKTGDWLTDLFHQTTPDMKRLRQQVQTLRSLPPNCVARHTASPSGFKRWQKEAVAFSDWEKQQVLPGLERTVKLSSPLQSDLTQIKFSPDGKFILTQDSAAIYILQCEPLSFLFEIPAEKAWPAGFTPDSQNVAFADESLEVEKWSIASQKRVSLNNVVVPRGCFDAELSADGKTLACLQPDSQLRLIDVPSGQTVYEVKGFSTPPTRVASIVFNSFEHMEFSPDGQIFMAAATGRTVEFNVAQRRSEKFRGALSSQLPGPFTFIDADRIAVKDHGDWNRVIVASFPEGKKLAEWEIGRRFFTSATRGDDLIIPYPDPNHGAGVLDVKTGQFVAKDKGLHLDVFTNTLATEGLDGQISLFDLKTRKLQGEVKLPRRSLVLLAADSVSPDMKWLAMSVGDRGGVWNLKTGQRKYEVRGFDGAWVDRDVAVYADFPKFEEAPHQIGGLGLEQHAIVNLGKVKDQYTSQHGRYLSILVPDYPNPRSPIFLRDTTRKICDVHTGEVLWSRHFDKETPALAIEPETGTGVLYWRASTDAAKEEVAKFASVAKAFRKDKDKGDDYFLEAFDIASGRSLGAVLVDTGRGSFGIADVFARGDRLYVASSMGEVLVYSLATGAKLGQVLGAWPVVSDAASLMAVRAEPAVIEIYNLHTFSRFESLSFSNPVILFRFGRDGNRLMALTSKQVAYFLGVSGLSAPSAVAAQ